MSEVDSFVLSLYQEMNTPMAAGSQMGLLRFRCKASGIKGRAARLEVWERVNLVHRIASLPRN